MSPVILAFIEMEKYLSAVHQDQNGRYATPIQVLLVQAQERARQRVSRPDNTSGSSSAFARVQGGHSSAIS